MKVYDVTRRRTVIERFRVVAETEGDVQSALRRLDEGFSEAAEQLELSTVKSSFVVNSVEDAE